jgi:small subunit ribosomal protein S4
LGELPGLVRKSSGKQNPPGQHGATPKKPSQYSLRLQEKQKLRFHYGLNERQLVNLVKRARRFQGSTGDRLLQLLELRLDTIIFRSGFAPTLRASRQLVSHGHVKVNNSTVNIPSFQCKPGDMFQVKKLKPVEESIQSGSASSLVAANHLESDQKNFTSTLKQQIGRTEVSCPINEFLVIEYYSRKV